MNSITITLRMPSMVVSQNARTGNSKTAALLKSQAVKAHRERAKLLLCSILNRPPFPITSPPLGYSLAFYYRTAMFRDEGNAEGSCKAYIDGIADALRMNDRHFRKLALTTQQKDATQPPRVEITLYFNTEKN
jgi:hypothetical protein